MAFEKQNNKLKESLKETNRTEEQSFMPFEKTKNYTFTLQPSVRNKISELAKTKGYRSASSFLNEYFKNF